MIGSLMPAEVGKLCEFLRTEWLWAWESFAPFEPVSQKPWTEKDRTHSFLGLSVSSSVSDR
jgi:hypothetical protein